MLCILCFMHVRFLFTLLTSYFNYFEHLYCKKWKQHPSRNGNNSLKAKAMVEEKEFNVLLND